MVARFIVSGPSNKSLQAELEQELLALRPRALGVAVAYVSIFGARFLKDLQNRAKIREIALVTDIGDAITHPEALRVALAEDWVTRTVEASHTFHAKLVVAGSGFDSGGRVHKAVFSLVGSANLSRGGLSDNAECSFFNGAGSGNITGAAAAFGALWKHGKPLTATLLSTYEKTFAERNRGRSPRDLKALGVADNIDADSGDVANIRTKKAPSAQERSIANAAASAAWAGLESFTGEHTLQVEFPRDAGEVLQRMMAAVTSGPRVDLECEDGKSRSMQYSYYHHNSMFRLNIQNDTPGVDWARNNHAGIAIVAQSLSAAGQFTLRLLRPGRDAMDAIGRSVALGTWGKTTTRLYGWF